MQTAYYTHPLPNPIAEHRAVALALALVPTGARAQHYCNVMARAGGWTDTLRRANYLRCKWQRAAGEYRWRQQKGGPGR
jgi:hypothetical protein